MKSIKARLGWVLSATLGFMLVAFVLSLYFFLRYLFLSNLDAALNSKARLFAASTETVGSNAFEFEMIEAQVPEYLPGSNAEYVQIWNATGETVLRSPSLAGQDICPAPIVEDAPQFLSITLPDNRAGRLVIFRFVPRAEGGTPVVPAGEPSSQLSIAFATSREAVELLLNRVLGGLVVGAFVLICCAMASLRFSIRIGLQPLEEIANQVSALRVSGLSHRFDAMGVPDELLPVINRLNELLSRLQAAFERERRFTADAAHELRTPVAELRTLAEVGLMETHAADAETLGYLRDTLAIAKHLESLIQALLMLARFEASSEEREIAEMDIASLIARALKAQDFSQSRPDLKVHATLPPRALVLAHEKLAGVLIENLLGNAATHTDAGGEVWVSLDQHEAMWRLRISNTSTGLDPANLPHIFEPFWRKSADRSGGEHAGLGLALVFESARLMDVALKATMPTPATFLIESLWRSSNSR